MKIFFPLFFLGILLLLTACKKGKTQYSNDETALPNYGNVNINDVFSRSDNYFEGEDSIKKTLNNYYQSVWENGNLSGGILIAKGDNILLEEYRGFAQDNEKEPINKNTPLHVASVSKTLTAMAVMKLVEAGKISLTDPVTKFFPKFPYPEVQVQFLLNQRSGLPKYEHFIEHIQPQPNELFKKFLTNRDILNLLTRYKPELSKKPGTGFMYCNTNYALLALIVEQVTKTSFPEAMNAMVFKPLKMKNTYIFKESDTLRASKSFYFRGNRLYPYDRLDLIYGDKNVYTTPRDLLNFSKAMFSKVFLKPELMQMVFAPYSNEKAGVNNYGLGFRMKIFDNGEKLTYHNGWWHGSNTVFAHLLKSKVTIIALGNKYSNRVYSALALSALFENFPYETEKLRKTLEEQDSLNVISADSLGE
ncbi:MAG: serine hydrolase domain-containing protein [Bergeyella sp.]